MRRDRIAFVAALTAAVLIQASSGVGRERGPARPPQEKKTAGTLFEKPAEPSSPRDEKPKAGWNGFYGGVNGGAATDR